MPDIPVKIVLEGLEEAEAGLRRLADKADDIKVDVTLDGIDEAKKELRDLGATAQDVQVQVTLDGIEEAQAGLRELASLGQDIPVEVQVTLEGIEEAGAALKDLVEVGGELASIGDEVKTAFSGVAGFAGLADSLSEATASASGLADSLAAAQTGIGGLAESLLAAVEPATSLIDILGEIQGLAQEIKVSIEVEGSSAQLGEVQKAIDETVGAAEEASKAIADLGKAIGELSTVSDAAKNMGDLATAIGDMVTRATEGATAFAGISAGVAGAGQAAATTVSQLSGVGDAIEAVAESTAKSTANLSTFSAALGSIGTSSEGAETQVEGLDDAMEGMASASGEATKEQRNLSEEATKLSAIIAVAEQGWAHLKDTLLGVAAGYISLTAVIGTVRGTLHGLFEEFEKGRKLGDTVEQTGVFAENLSKLAFAADVTGTSLTGLTRGAAQLSRAYEGARGGSDALEEAFTKLGISTDKARDANELLLLVADGLKALGPGAERTSLGMQLLGRSFIQTIPLLAKGSEELKKLGFEAEQAGSVLTGPQLAAMDKVATAIDRIGKASDGLSTSLAKTAASGFGDFLDRIAKALLGSDLDQKFAQLGQRIGDAFANAAKESDIGDVFGKALINGLPVVLDAIAEILGRITNLFITTAPQIALGFAEGIAVALVTSFPVAFATLGTVVGAGLGAVLGGPLVIGAVAGAGLLIGTGLGQAISEAVAHRLADADLGEAIAGRAAETLAAAGEKAGAALSKGVQAGIEGDVAGVQAAIDTINHALDELVQKRQIAIRTNDPASEKALTAEIERLTASLGVLQVAMGNAEEASRSFGGGLQYLSDAERAAAESLGKLGAQLSAQLVSLRAYGAGLQEAAAAAGSFPISSEGMLQALLKQTRAEEESKNTTEKDIQAKLKLVEATERQKVANQSVLTSDAVKKQNQEIEIQNGLLEKLGKGTISQTQYTEQLTASQDRLRGVDEKTAAAHGQLVGKQQALTKANQEGTAAATKAASASDALAESSKRLVRESELSLKAATKQADVLQQVVDGSLTGAAATKLLAEATADAAAQKALDAGVSETQAAAIRANTLATEEQIQRQKELQAIQGQKEDLADLRAKIAILKQVEAGTKSLSQALHELAVREEVARQGKITDPAKLAEVKKLAEEVVSASEEFDKLRDAAQETSGAVIEAGHDMANALADVIFEGTSLTDAFKQLGKNWGRQIFTSILTEKLGFDGKFNANILGLGGGITKTLGGAFGGVFEGAESGVGSLISGIGSLFGLVEDGVQTFGPGGTAIGPPTAAQAAGGVGLGSIVSGGLQGAAVGGTVGTLIGGAFFPLPKVPQELLPYIAGGAGQTEALKRAQRFQAGSLYGGVIGGAIGGGVAAAGGAGAAAAAALGPGGAGIAGLAGPTLSILGSAAGYAAIAAIAAIVILKLTEHEPTHGTVVRRFGEDILDRSQSFKQLQGEFGDFRKNVGTQKAPAITVTSTQFGAPGGYLAPGSGRDLIFLEHLFPGISADLGIDLTGPSRFTKLPPKTVAFPEESEAERLVRTRALLEEGRLGRGKGGKEVTEKEVNEYLATVGGGATGIFEVLFSQAEGVLPEEAARGAKEMGLAMAEFFSRGFKEGLTMEEILEKAGEGLRAFAKEVGVDVYDIFEATGKIFYQFENARLNYAQKGTAAITELEQRHLAAQEIGRQQAGAIAIFEPEFAPGTQLGLQAIQAMEKDGVAAYENLSQAEKDWIVASISDTTKAAEVYAMLAEKGLEVNIEKFKELAKTAQESALVVGPALQQAFEAETPAAAFDAIGKSLGDNIKKAVHSAFTAQLLDKTAIGTAFQPVFAVLDRIEEFDLTKVGEGETGGLQDFKKLVLDSIIEGKKNLADYIPILKEMVKASKEVDKLIDDAFKPTEMEEFFLVMEARIEANKQAIEGLIQQVVALGVASANLTPEERATGIQQFFHENIQSAQKTAALQAAEKGLADSPAAKRLAELTAEYEVKWAAAMQDGIITGAEAADLSAVGEQMEVEGRKLAVGAEQATTLINDQFKDSAAQTRAEILADYEDAKKQQASILGGPVQRALQARLVENKPLAEVKTTFAEDMKKSITEAIIQGMTDAIVNAAIIQGIMAPFFALLQYGVTEAMADGVIDAQEQANLSKLINIIVEQGGKAIDQIMPLLEQILGITEPARLLTPAEKKKKERDEEAARKSRDRDTRDERIDQARRDKIVRDREAREKEEKRIPRERRAPPPDELGRVSAADEARRVRGEAPARRPPAIVEETEHLRKSLREAADTIDDGNEKLRRGTKDLDLIDPEGVRKFRDALDETGKIEPRHAKTARTAIGELGEIDPAKVRRAKLGVDELEHAVEPGTVRRIAGGTEGLEHAVRKPLVDDIAGSHERIATGNRKTAIQVEEDRKAKKDAADKEAKDAKAKADADKTAAEALTDTGKNIATAGDSVVTALQKLAEEIAKIEISGPGGGGGGAPPPEEDGRRPIDRGGREPVGGGQTPGPVRRDVGGTETTASILGLETTASSSTRINRNLNRPVPPPRSEPRNPSTPLGRSPIGVNPNEPPKTEEEKKETVSVSFSFDEALDAYFAGGTDQELEKAISEATGQGMIAGLITAIFSPDIEAATKKIGDLLQKAKGDGIITPEELAAITAESKKLGAQMQKDAQTLKPILKDVAKDFGVDLAKSTSEGILGGLKDAFLQYASGDIGKDELEKQMKEATFSGIVSGLIDAIIASPAVQEAMQEFSDYYAKAIEDGVITAKEARHIDKIFDNLGDVVLGQLDAAAPGIDKLKKRFGIGKTVGQELFDDIKGGISSAFLSAKTPAEFINQVKGSIYQSVLKGLVDALISSVIIQGALAPLLAQLTAIWKKAAEDGTQAGINAAIVASGPILGQIGVQVDKLGPVFTLFDQTAKDWAASLGYVAETSDKIAASAEKTTDAVNEQTEAAATLHRETVDIGEVAADLLGAQAKAAFEFVVPRFPPGSENDPARDEFQKKMLELLDKLLKDGVEATTYLDGVQVSEGVQRSNRRRARAGAATG